jgi:hypothetical protein
MQHNVHKALSIIIGVCLCTHVLADDLRIVGFDHDGYLTFQGASIGNYFTLEFATAVEGPWTNWGSVSGQPISGTVMSSPTPMFYRIRQSSSQDFPLLATGTPVYVESDPIFDLSAAATIRASDLSIWDTAYSWGNHANANYLSETSQFSGDVTGTASNLNINETDPVFDAAAAATIGASDIMQWDEAQSWGNHASADYMSTTQQFSGSVTGVATNLYLADDAFGFGERTSLSYGVIRQATEDGFAVWYGLQGSDSHSAYYYIKADITTPPSTTRAYSRPNGAMANMITCPIRKGEYWNATESGDYVAGSRTLYWIPLLPKR